MRLDLAACPLGRLSGGPFVLCWRSRWAPALANMRQAQRSEGLGAVAVLKLYCVGTNYHVISARREETWPTSAALELGVPRNARCSWLVEVHGAYATTDAAAHPDGTLTRSAFRTLKTAP